MGGEFLISSILNSGEASEDSGEHFVVILEGVIVVPRWSVTSGSIIVVVVLLFGLLYILLIRCDPEIYHVPCGAAIEAQRASLVYGLFASFLLVDGNIRTLGHVHHGFGFLNSLLACLTFELPLRRLRPNVGIASNTGVQLRDALNRHGTDLTLESLTLRQSYIYSHLPKVD